MPRGFNQMQGQQGWTIDRKLEILIKGYSAEAERIGVSLAKIPSMTQNKKFEARNKLRDYAQKHWSRKWYTSYSVFAEFLYQTGGISGYHVDKAYIAIKPLLNREGEQDGPFVLTKNPPERGGNRIPLKWDELDNNYKVIIEKKARAQFTAVKNEVAERLNKDRQQNQEQQLDDDEDEQLQGGRNEQELEQLGEIEESESEDLQEIEDEQTSLGKEFENFWLKYVEIREYSERNDVGGHQIDTIERRPYEAAVPMIANGIPTEAILHAMTMHWSPTDRAQVGITDYDVREFKKNIERPAGMPPEFHYLDALVKGRVWPWLISAAGVGKTTIVRKFAVYYGQPWCAIPLNRGTSPSAFNGRVKINNTSIMVRFMKAMVDQNAEEMTKLAKQAERDGDVTISEFCKICMGGGHILFDELDAGDENLLMMANMPLANARFANTATGETIEVHPDTIFWAASNTMGMGVTAGSGREYRARNALDFATIDRFRMGRVRMKGDINDYREHYEQLVAAYQS